MDPPMAWPNALWACVWPHIEGRVMGERGSGERGTQRAGSAAHGGGASGVGQRAAADGWRGARRGARDSWPGARGAARRAGQGGARGSAGVLTGRTCAGSRPIRWIPGRR